MSICVVVGTRPEIIKMSCIMHELVAREIPFTLVHSGQHYDSNLSDVFFRELDLPSPDIDLEVGSGTQAEQTASAMVKLERVFVEKKPSLILVEGDTNTVLAGALSGAKLGITVGHVESGLRSYDLRMPEEHNRRLTDHLSSYLFAPTKRAVDTLTRESCWGKIILTGNTIIDACLLYGKRAHERTSILNSLPSQDFALATIHRAENVDDPHVLRQFLQLFSECPIPVVCAIHPRTSKRLQAMGLDHVRTNPNNVTLIPPQGYLDFLALLMRCQFVLTDSGGIQEEATAPNIRKKVFVLRNKTERLEAVESGFAELVGTNATYALERLHRFLEQSWIPRDISPFGDIADAIQDMNNKVSAGPIAIN